MPALKADLYNVDVVVKIGNKEVVRKTFGEFANAMTGSITIDGVAVGMAELTETITIELQNKKTKAVLDAYETSAKAYADALIAADGIDLTVKNAVAGLLQYGATVQVHFGYKTDKLAMTDTDVANWTTLGLELAMIADNELDVSGATVQATASGTRPAAVTLSGATLTMENEMSLRIYFTADSLEGLTFTVGGVATEAVSAGGTTYYLEASNIGTGKLANAVAFTFSDGANTYTYNASPMSYVYTVHSTNHASITESLKNACEALYYYYAAVAECFDSVTDGTGFSAADALMVTADTSTEYCPPVIL